MATDYNKCMKKIMLALGLVILALTACAPAGTSEIYALGTVCSQQVYGGDCGAAIAEVDAMLLRITGEYAINGALTGKISSAAPNPAELTDEAAALIGASLDMAALTGGAFDPTIGPVSVLWDITGNPKVPSRTDVQKALELVDYNNVKIDGNTVSLAKKGMILDLGGIAKGYAADIAAEIYKKHGIKSALLNLGGNIYAFGARKDGKDWRIGIRDPKGQPGEHAAAVAVSDKSVVTSGGYERFFESGGQTYHHIFDPYTGYPAQNGLLAVTVICKNSTMADALSTAFFVMGLDDGLALANRLDAVEAVFFTDEKEVYITDGLKESIEITNETYTIKS